MTVTLITEPKPAAAGAALPAPGSLSPYFPKLQLLNWLVHHPEAATQHRKYLTHAGKKLFINFI